MLEAIKYNPTINKNRKIDYTSKKNRNHGDIKQTNIQNCEINHKMQLKIIKSSTK